MNTTNNANTVCVLSVHHYINNLLFKTLRLYKDNLMLQKYTQSGLYAPAITLVDKIVINGEKDTTILGLFICSSTIKENSTHITIIAKDL